MLVIAEHDAAQHNDVVNNTATVQSNTARPREACRLVAACVYLVALESVLFSLGTGNTG
jgi:hypothetical protein